MQKKLLVLLLLTCFILCSTGCSSSTTEYSAVFENDTISISLDDTYTYTENSETQFSIKKDSKILFDASFTTPYAYDQYVREVVDAPGSTVTLLKQDRIQDNPFIFYKKQRADSIEFIYVLRIHNSNSAVVLTNKTKQEEAEECFKNISFSFDK